MISERDSQLAELIAAVQASARYRTIDATVIERVGRESLQRYPSLKAAIKAAKTTLHQMIGAYADRALSYSQWLAELQSAPDKATRQAACLRLMAHHASTRERLPVFNRLYPACFGDQPPQRVLDLGCGLNPLAIPWMELPPTTWYAAYDIDTALSGFIRAALPLLGVQGEANTCDLAAGPPPVAADVVLVLKTLPLLEQQRRGAGADLLRAIQAPRLVVSFPTLSLGGRNVGMATTYRGYMDALAAAEGWSPRVIELPNELVFVIDRHTPSRSRM
ncbi:16S rRNA methyltransferase [Chloroflexus sp.]|uniref:16S rRNA methyltransferase n=1 Tax=Chloroflexus sp. TaxID=1904827 RepID=UPI002ACEA566|nr:16S rRNA methyltransferase [Chloroflexus sp.]